MAFVFYDLETTGTNTRFDQILQFAAVRTDADLVEQERIELCCRLDPHVVPHPAALILTRRSLDNVRDTSLPSHYEMMREIVRRIEDWSPATIIGFNSIRFDEEMLRHSLYKTLHNPYLTSFHNNIRADALTLCRAVAFFSPGAITVPIDADGKPRFTLQLLSEANGGPEFEAHSAIGDVEAMLALCRLVMVRDGEGWSRFLQFASKAAAASLIDQGSAFGAIRFHGNSPRPTVATLLGRTPLDANVRFCLELTSDLDTIAAMTDGELQAKLSSADSPVFKIRINGCPAICELWDVPETVRTGVDDTEFDQRATRVAEDARLRDRLLSLVLSAQAPYPVPEHIEEQLYQTLPPREDDDALREFHAADWAKRPAVIQRLTDTRWRKLALRLIYLEAPHLLEPSHRERMDQAIAERLRAEAGTKPWTTIADALAAMIALGDACPPSMGASFRAMLQQRDI